MAQFVQVDLETPDGQPARLYLQQPSVLAVGRFNTHLEQAWEEIDARYGPAEEGKGKKRRGVLTERDAASIYTTAWATLKACTVRYEVLNGDGSYHDAPWPWSTYLEYCEQLPIDSQRVLADAAARIGGPALGFKELDEEGQKKEPSATMTLLTKLPAA